MNTANAIGFFLLGTVMQIVPLWSGAGLGAESTQTLWLQFMGLVTGTLGAGYLLRVATGELSTMISRIALRRGEAREQALQPTAAQEVPLGVRVTF